MQSGTGVPKNHHFVPQLLQRQWADSEEKVKCWMWKNDSITSFNPNIKNIMTETHLYLADHIGNPEIYERTFSGLEAHAAVALRKFRDPARPSLAREDYESWACFVLAQRIRVPDKLAWAKKHVREGFVSVFEKYDPDFDHLNVDERFKTPSYYLTEYHPNVLANFHLQTMIDIIHDPKNVSAILRLKWFIDLGYPRSIALGDDPLILVGSLHSDRCLIALPISADEIFFAASTDVLVNKITKNNTKNVSIRVNEDQVNQAVRLVIGDIAPRFLEKRLRKTTLPFSPNLPSY